MHDVWLYMTCVDLLLCLPPARRMRYEQMRHAEHIYLLSSCLYEGIVMVPTYLFKMAVAVPFFRLGGGPPEMGFVNRCWDAGWAQ